MQQSVILAIVFDSSSSHLALELEINHLRNDGIYILRGNNKIHT